MANDITAGDGVLHSGEGQWQSLSDRLSESFADGDLDQADELFGQLQEKTIRWLLAVARSKLPEEDAQDAVAEVYLNLFDHLRSNGEQIRQIKAYLRMLVNRRIVDSLRSRKEEVADLSNREVSGVAELLSATEEDPIEASEVNMVCRTLKNVLLEAMPSPEKEILFLRHYYGLTVEQTASRLRLTVDTVKKRTRKAIEAALRIAQDRGIEL